MSNVIPFPVPEPLEDADLSEPWWSTLNDPLDATAGVGQNS